MMLQIMLWFFVVLIRPGYCNELLWGERNPSRVPPQEVEHFPEFYTTTLTPYINGTEYKIPDPSVTPDYRIEEQPYFVYNYYGYLREELRPYRISPHYYQTYNWPWKYNPDNFGCSCTTVYKRLHLLAGCALLTTRHIITTATSTEHVLKDYKGKTNVNLEGILGVWYDTNTRSYNSSYYFTPVRIHYHPKYMRQQEVNVSNPIPCQYDLSVWASDALVQGYWNVFNRARFCQRAASGMFYYTSSIALPGDMAVIVGFQFIKAYRRKPMPWYKYALRTKEHVLPCPKTEWGWFHCIMGDWAKLGLEQGASYHMAFLGETWRRDGLAGINAFSLKLRSLQLVHYFLVLDTYPVLDFLYDAYLGRQKPEFMDNRFYDTRGKAPVVKPWFSKSLPYRYNYPADPGYYGYPPYY